MQRRGGRRGGGGEEGAVVAAVRKGAWSAEEDEVLRQHVRHKGPRDWSSIRSNGLLRRTGKSCRLRWVNKLLPGLKMGCKFTPEEERTVIEMQAKDGNKWAMIATKLTGRTDNDVKNFWSTRLKRQARAARNPAMPRGRSTRHNSGASSSRSQGLPPSPMPLCQGPCSDMIPFQEAAHHVGQSSSQEPPLKVEYQSADEPFPLPLSLTPPIGFPMDAFGCGSSSTAAVPPTHLPFGGGHGGNRGSGADTPTFFFDTARFVDVEPLAVVPPPAPLLAPLAEVSPPAPFLAPPAAAPPAPFFGVDGDHVEPLAVVPSIPFFGVDLDDYYELLAPPPRRGRLCDVHFDDLTAETLDFFTLLPPPPPPSNYL
ncbi:hypothetical protein ACP70R_015733 [Stipagrostis hirtigluma subsp. patula]